MPDYAWPDAEHRTLIGKRISRVDSPAKVSGQAKYTYDVHRPGMLYGKVLRSPYAHAKLVSVDISVAEKMPGVKAVHVVQEPGSTIYWEGDEIVAVAAVDELTAEDAVPCHQSGISAASVPGHRYRASTGIGRGPRPVEYGRYR